LVQVHCIRYFPHGPQHVHMKTLREYLPVAPQRRIECLCNADCQPLHPARERRAIVGLDDQMEMVSIRESLDPPDTRGNLRHGVTDPLAAPRPTPLRRAV